MVFIEKILKQLHLLYIYQKYQQVIHYLIFGVVSTITSFSVYIFCAKALDIHYLWSSVISWIVAVGVAYVTNKLYVFGSRGKTRKENIKEAIVFYAMRLVSLGIDLFTMYIMVDILNMWDIASKVINCFVVVIINYVFSKLIVFGKKRPEEK